MDIIQHYQSILQIYDTNQIIRNLDQRRQTATFFTDTIKQLQTLHLNRETGDILYKSQPKENIIEINKGAYGKIYLSDDPRFVYKEIIYKEEGEDLEHNIREVFLELFIQTVLIQDQELGKHICKAFKLYRSEHSYKAKAPFSLFIKMECLPTSLHDRLFKNNQFTMKNLADCMQQLITLLEQLKTKYKFSHRDLHVHNIMFQGDTIKLIDFGFSRLEFEGVTYSLQQDVVVKQTETTVLQTIELQEQPQSHDILVFLSSFLHYYGSNLLTEDKAFLLSLFETEKGVNLYEIWLKRSKHPVFHMFYDWIRKEEWPQHLEQALHTEKRFKLEAVRDAFTKKIE